MKMIIDRSATRGHANHGWLDTWHTFSFADYYNPDRMGFGSLRVLNDDTVAPGRGFDRHPHKNMEVVSIPLHGRLSHGDSLQNNHVIQPGEIQIMSAGTGIFHSEYNPDPDEILKFLQIWVIPDEMNIDPQYADYNIRPLLKKNEISVFIAPDSRIHLHQQAWFSWGALDEGVSASYSLKGHGTGVYVFVIKGEVKVGDAVLHARDGAGIYDTSSLSISALVPSDVLLIEVPYSPEE